MFDISTENHFIVAHRDDALLTFGGILVKSRLEGIKNIVHVIYGIDPYILPTFREGIVSKSQDNIKYLKSLRVNSGDSGEYLYAILEKELYSKSPDYDLISVIIRSLEEKSVAKALDIKLFEYNFCCGYPLRGYKSFNSAFSDTNPNDHDDQIELLFGKNRILLKEESLKYEQVNTAGNVPVLRNVVDSLMKNPNLNANLFFLSGIGGHPDHIILAKCGSLISEMGLKNTNILFGQDVPYSSEYEWYGYSPLVFEEKTKKYLDISPYLDRKLRLLKSFYKSQLRSEDIRIIREIHRSRRLKTGVGEYYEILYK